MGHILLATTPRGKGFGSFRYGSNGKSPLATTVQPPSTPTPTGGEVPSYKRRRVGDDMSVALAGTTDSLERSEEASETASEKGKQEAESDRRHES